MPAMMSWPVSSLVKQRKVGSSSARRCRPSPIFSRSALVLGSTAIEMTGSGKVGGSSSDLEVLVAKRVAGGDVPQAHQRGDVAGINVVSTSMRLSAWIIITRLTRSRLRVRGL